MKMFKATSLMAGLFFLAACVTINIYFPAAEAREAAEQIVEDILGDEAKTQAPEGEDHSMRTHPEDRGYAFNLFDLLIPTAEAAAKPKFDADTPEVRRLQKSMKQRHAALRGFYQQGAIGFTQDAMVDVRQLSAVSLKQRGQLKNLVKAENKDRNQFYKEIARANGHPEWEKDVRSVFAKTWVSKAAKGWWYQNSKGEWVQK